jgi:sensor histidine kinase YesM
MIPKRKRTNFHSVIARKVTKKMFFLYFSIYFFILLLLIGILTPKLYKKDNDEAMEVVSLIADEYDNAQSQLTTYMDSIYLFENLSQYITEYAKNPSDLLRSNISLELGHFNQLSSQIATVTLETMEHEFFSDYYYSTTDKQAYLHSNTSYMNLFQYKRGSCYTHPESDFLSASASISYTVITYSMIINFNNVPYVVTIFYNMQTAIEHSKQIASPFMEAYMVLDRYQNVIYSTDPEWKPEGINSIFTYNKIQDCQRSSGGVFYYARIPSSSWYIFSYSPYRKLLSNLYSIIGIITLLYLISPVLYCTFLIPIIQTTLAPLTELSDAMKSFSAGDTPHLHLNTHDEIQNLNDSFNQMVLQINTQIENIKEQEHKNSVINYKLLATQVDPHFIYNSMNIINILARNGNTDDIIEINSALIRILRERLNSKITIFDKLENEIDTLLQYETIMRYRYNDKIKLHCEVDEALNAVLIPKNILQPLVENAFIHGFDNHVEAEGYIDVMIYQIENEIVIEVSDNGKGMSNDRIQQILTNDYHLYEDKKPHIGIENIRERLAYIYKDKFTLDIQSTLGYGTTFIIVIPYENSPRVS